MKRPGLRSYFKWCEEVGWTRITGWRARKRGWVKTENICGRLYITDSEIARFVRRTEAGEFAKNHVVPKAA